MTQQRYTNIHWKISSLNDPYGCFNDWENEKLDQLRYDAHIAGECNGIPECIWCIEYEEQLDK